jgi:tetratricopeptide (TPR) repeat protein
MARVIVLLVWVIAIAAPVYAQDAQQPVALPVIAQPLLDRADQALTAQYFESARLDLSLFILLNPTFSPAYFGRAQANLGLDDLDAALKDVNRALETAQDAWTTDYNASLYSLRAQIDQRQERLDDALDDYSQSITLQPTVQALAGRGLLYLSSDDLTAALDDFNGAVNLDENNPVLYIYRGLINGQLRNVEATGADYLHFFSLIQTNPVSRPEIQPGQMVSLNVDQGVIYILPFTAKAGQFASALAVGRSGDVDPLLVLIDGAGNPLAGDDDGGGSTSALILDYPIETDGQYTLLVGHSLGGFTGQVALQIQVSDTPSE